MNENLSKGKDMVSHLYLLGTDVPSRGQVEGHTGDSKNFLFY